MAERTGYVQLAVDDNPNQLPVPQNEREPRPRLGPGPGLGPEPLPEPEPQPAQDEPRLGYEVAAMGLRRFLFFLGFYGHFSSCLGIGLSGCIFIFFGALAPFYTIFNHSWYIHEHYEISRIEIGVTISQFLLGLFSLVCISRYNYNRDDCNFFFALENKDDLTPLYNEYIKEIKGFSSACRIWILPCLALKIFREAVCIIYIKHESYWMYIFVRFVMLISWLYLSIISISGFLLFKLLCNLKSIQLIHCRTLFGGGELVIPEFRNVYIRLLTCLEAISKRFELFLLLAFITVTIGQFVTLSQFNGFHGIFNILNDGDFVITTIVQVGGIIMCCNAALTIVVEGKRVESAAIDWHNVQTHDFIANNSFPLMIGRYLFRSTFIQYLEGNRASINVFNWTVDTTLVTTLTSINFSLLLFVLGNVINVSTKNDILRNGDIGFLCSEALLPRPS